MELEPAQKTAFFYLKDKCDNVGVWSPNFKLADIQIGCHIDWEKLVEDSNENIIILENGKWFIKDFCEFQYGGIDFNSNSKPIQSYIKTIEKHNLTDFFKGLSKGIDGVSVSVHKQDKEKVKEKEKGVYGELDNVYLLSDQYANLVRDYGVDVISKYVEKLSLYIPNGKRKYKDHNATIRTWLNNDNVKKIKSVKLPPETNNLMDQLLNGVDSEK
jgi:hypothetical protein